jgi:membrane protease YdiL (CAAX protease family)
MGVLLKYYFLTFLVSWTCFISVIIISNSTEVNHTGFNQFQHIILFLGVIAPSLVAIWLSSRDGAPGQTQKILGKIGRWKVNIKWYLFAAGFMIAVKLLVALIHKTIMGTWPQFGQEAWYIMLIAILFSTWVLAGEEIGWRGFALPLMSARFGLPVSVLILGMFWACWHLPLFFLKGGSVYGQSFPLYFLQVTALSVVIGWLYWRTNGSLLLTMLMHAAVNNTKDIVPSAVLNATDPFSLSHSLVGWLTVIVLWIFAAYCLIRMYAVRTIQ